MICVDHSVFVFSSGFSCKKQEGEDKIDIITRLISASLILLSITRITKITLLTIIQVDTSRTEAH